MLEGKKTATKPPVRKAPAALGETVKENEVTRRSFFSWLSLGWVAFVAATGGFFTMMLRFFFQMYFLNQYKHFERVIQMIILLAK